jgi:hypothetical protein
MYACMYVRFLCACRSRRKKLDAPDTPLSPSQKTVGLILPRTVRASESKRKRFFGPGFDMDTVDESDRVCVDGKGGLACRPQPSTYRVSARTHAWGGGYRPWRHSVFLHASTRPGHAPPASPT